MTSRDDLTGARVSPILLPWYLYHGNRVGRVSMKADKGGDPAFASPLSPVVLQIMIALGEGESHGYAIMQEVEASTGGKVVLAPGTLYRAIKRMLDTGLIVEVSDRPVAAGDDERRRYYRLTDEGHRAAAAERRRMMDVVAAMDARPHLGSARALWRLVVGSCAVRAGGLI